LYDIRPGNGAGLFLQARSPHEAMICSVIAKSVYASQMCIHDNNCCVCLHTRARRFLNVVVDYRHNEDQWQRQQCVMDDFAS